MTTKNDRILRHIQDHCFVGEYETRMNRYGEPVSYKRYRIADEAS